MKRTKLFHPYLSEKTKTQSARATLKITGAGVYFITEKIGDKFKLVYIGYSGTDVKKTMYRHFQKWIDKRHPENKRVQRIERVSYFDKNFINTDYKCKVFFCKNANEAASLESALINKLKPRDNSFKMGFDAEVQFYLKKYKEADELPASQTFEDLPF
jgi:hypothetical protein